MVDQELDLELARVLKQLASSTDPDDIGSLGD